MRGTIGEPSKSHSIASAGAFDRLAESALVSFHPGRRRAVLSYRTPDPLTTPRWCYARVPTLGHLPRVQQLKSIGQEPSRPHERRDAGQGAVLEVPENPSWYSRTSVAADLRDRHPAAWTSFTEEHAYPLVLRYAASPLVFRTSLARRIVLASIASAVSWIG